MSPRTIFLSKLIGLCCLFAALSMVFHKQTTIDMVTALLQSAPMLFLTGLISVTAGLAVILGHNVWSGGALPVVVTLTGWSALIKGLMFLFLSPQAEADVFLGALHYQQLFYFYGAISLILGIYLTYGGFRRRQA